MALTEFGIVSVILNIVLAVILFYVVREYLKLRKQVKRLVNELDTDSLEHYLNEIKKRGFEFTLKPKGKGKEVEKKNK
jgi:large-conductance mechanosensitive channel